MHTIASRPDRSSRSNRSNSMGMLAFTLVYAALLRISTYWFSIDGIACFVYFPTGLALALFLLKGTPCLPWAFLGATLGNLLSGTSLVLAVSLGGSQVLGMLLCAWVLRQHTRFDLRLLYPRDFALLLSVGIACCTFTALVGPAFLWLGGVTASQSYREMVLVWWQGDLLGVLLLTPTILVWQHPPRIRIRQPRQWMEVLLCFGLSFLCGQVVFLGWLNTSLGDIIEDHWIYVFVVWGALRFGRHGVLALILITAMQALAGAASGAGGYSHDFSHFNSIHFWAFVSIAMCVGMSLALIIRSRDELQSNLQRSEKTLSTILQTLPVAVFGKDISQGYAYSIWNQACENLFGIPAQDCIGKRDHELFPTEQAVFFAQTDLEANQSPGGLDIPPNETTYQQGKRIIHTRKIVVRDAKNQPSILVGISEDITERKRAEITLRESEIRLAAAFENARVGMALLSPMGQWLKVNRALCTLLGHSADALLTMNLQDLSQNDDYAASVEQWLQLVAGQTHAFQTDMRFVQSSGALIWCRLGVSLLRAYEGSPEFLVAEITDISAKKAADQALRDMVAEKTALLNEVHHRVKNNLQIVTSLLNMESRRSPHPQTKEVLSEMQGRIRSMALLHESLYRSGTFASVDLGVYLGELATQAFRSQNLTRGAVRLQLNLGHAPVSMDQATPCGLLVNELITNSLKHGFPNGRGGEVQVELRLEPDLGDATPYLLYLCVSDNGVGLPADFAPEKLSSLGLQLAYALAQQIGGVLNATTNAAGGASFFLRFSPDMNATTAQISGLHHSPHNSQGTR